MRIHILLACLESKFKTFQNIDWALVFDQKDLVSKQIVRMIGARNLSSFRSTATIIEYSTKSL